MRNQIVLIVFLFLIVGFIAFWLSKNTPQKPANLVSQRNHTMQLTSSAFEDNQPIPTKYTCQGEGINPPVSFGDIPSDTKSLALIVDDPDAPSGTFVHWVVWNMPPLTPGIEERKAPAGASEGLNGSGKSGYMGPCPPSGEHHYHFKLYALDTLLSLPAESNETDVEAAMKDHILDQAEFIGTYKKL
jgi:Raf kinase inhibitor-like YbhB/YbcL family protein